MYYAAYAVLVIGTIVALAMSERPLPSTVVALALFSFNTAAILFLAPAVLNFIVQMREASSTRSEVRAALNDLKGQLENLQQKVSIDQVSLGSALAMTAQASPAGAHVARISSIVSPQAQTERKHPAPLFAKKETEDFHPPFPTHHAEQMGLFGSVATHTPASSSASPALTQTISGPSAEVSMVATVEAVPPALVSEEANNQTPIADAAKGPITLLLTAHIDENDVLCLRGEGGGLNWQEGVPLNYEGNDRWSYKIPEATAPVVCRVYLNDEISAFGEDLLLNPGQTLDIAPSFPKIEA